MPRKKLIRTDQYFYHITTRSNHRQWFSIPLSQVWEIATESFIKAQKNNPADVYQFVLMSNHYHMLIRTPNSDIDKFMFWFNKTFSDELRKESGNINRMFGSNYKWSLITYRRYLYNVYKYIYQNPLRVNIVSKCEDYPYSTRFYQLRNIPTSIPILHITDMDDINLTLNERLSSVQESDIKSGLKKTTYRPNSKRNRRRIQSQK